MREVKRPRNVIVIILRRAVKGGGGGRRNQCAIFYKTRSVYGIFGLALFVTSRPRSKRSRRLTDFKRRESVAFRPGFARQTLAPMSRVYKRSRGRVDHMLINYRSGRDAMRRRCAGVFLVFRAASS